MNDIRFVLSLIAQTFLAIARNWSVVLRITCIPILLPTGVLIGWGYWAYKSAYLVHYLPEHVGGGGEFPVFATVLGLIILVGTLPVAVAWHRFDLLGELPSALRPRLHFSLLPGYFGRSLLLALTGFLIGLATILPIYPFVESYDGSFNFSYGNLPSPPTARNFVLNAVFWSVAMGLLTAFFLILPASALGRRMRLSESWLETEAAVSFAGLLELGLILHLANTGLNLVLAEISAGMLGLTLVPFVILFNFMFGIALATKLYGHCVEGRRLV